MKKIISLIAMMAMTVTMTACGTSTNTATEKTDSKTAQTESDMAYIKDKGKMTIGYTLFKPMNFKDEKDELTGFETEFAKLVCEKLGVEPDFQEIDWDSKEIELNSKNIDCIWNGMTITDERKQNMSITTPYMTNRQVMIMKEENKAKFTENVGGASVVAEKGSTGEELVESDPFFASCKYTALDSQAKGLMDVASGTSDIVIGDYVMACGSVGSGTDYKDLVLVDKNFESQDYGVAFRKGSDVTEEVNKAMKELASEGKLQQLAEKYNLQDLLLIK